MQLIQLLKFIMITFSTSHIFMCNGESVSCTGHDACKNKIWNGEYDISCGASNSERTCKSTTLNCAAAGDCTIKLKEVVMMLIKIVLLMQKNQIHLC